MSGSATPSPIFPAPTASAWRPPNGSFTASALVLATGGLSIPKMGATGFAYDVARRFGLSIIEPQPGLVPLKATPEALGFERASRRRFPGSHRVLRATRASAKTSCSRTAASPVRPFFKSRPTGGRAIRSRSTSRRIATRARFCWSASAHVPRRKRRPCSPRSCPPASRTRWPKHACRLGRSANIPDRTLAAFAARLKRWEVQPADSEGWPKAEVTVGGIDTRDLSSKTMEARNVPGLYAIGEAVDVTGWLGGYNFQWAWSSGWCAGQAVS